MYYLVCCFRGGRNPVCDEIGFSRGNNPLKFGDNILWYGHKGREENR